jgi:hypothetical protein
MTKEEKKKITALRWSLTQRSKWDPKKKKKKERDILLLAQKFKLMGLRPPRYINYSNVGHKPHKCTHNNFSHYL